MALPGDAVINTALIASPRGTFNLNTANFQGSRVYESIYDNNNLVEIDVFDTDDAIGNLIIQGDEFINLSFNAPGTPPLNYVCCLDKIQQISITGTQKGRYYTIFGVGQETFMSKFNYVQKSYNTDIASMVKDVHTNYLHSNKSLNSEQTEGQQQLVIPNLKPFDAIELMRTRAVSSTNPSSTFLYFENSAGMNFRTIEGMFKTPSVKTFYRSDTVASSVYNNSDYNNIISWDVPQYLTSTEKITLGGLKQRVATFDARTRQYSNNDVFPPYVIASQFFRNLYGGNFGMFNYIPIDTTKSPTYISQMTPYQLGFISELIQSYLNIKVNGDTTYKAGDVITLYIPQPVSITNLPVLDPIFSGQYVISRICRNIGKLQEKPRYIDNIECISISIV